MNKHFWISVVVMFVVAMLLGFVVHELLLGKDYARLTTLFRTKEDAGGHFGRYGGRFVAETLMQQGRRRQRRSR